MHGFGLDGSVVAAEKSKHVSTGGYAVLDASAPKRVTLA
jgi:hypothetical protein